MQAVSAMSSDNRVPANVQEIETANKMKSGDGVELLFSKLTENAFTPTRGSAFAAGHDLYRYLFMIINCTLCAC